VNLPRWQRHISESLLAEAYIGLGENDEAMAWLERAYDEHDQWMVYIKAYPGLGCLAFRTALSGFGAGHEFSAVGQVPCF
jgi:hypothetical protein